MLRSLRNIRLKADHLCQYLSKNRDTFAVREKVISFSYWQGDLLFAKGIPFFNKIFIEKTNIRLFLILFPYFNRDKFKVLQNLDRKLLVSVLF